MQFECWSKFDVKWTFKRKSLPANSKVISGNNSNLSLLKIINVTIENKGKYWCQARNKKKKYTFRDHAELVVTGGKVSLWYYTFVSCGEVLMAHSQDFQNGVLLATPTLNQRRAY